MTEPERLIYADQFKIIFQGRDDYRQVIPGADLEIVFSGLSERVPVDELMRETEAIIGPNFISDERTRHTSWGADATTWQVLYDVSKETFEYIAAAGGAGAVVKMLGRKLKDKVKGDPQPLTHDDVVSQAKFAAILKDKAVLVDLDEVGHESANDDLRAVVHLLDRRTDRRYTVTFEALPGRIRRTDFRWEV